MSFGSTEVFGDDLTILGNDLSDYKPMCASLERERQCNSGGRDMPRGVEDDSSVTLSTKDLKAMGLAAGGKLGGCFPNPLTLRRGPTHHICS
jgi:hypothetical protein